MSLHTIVLVVLAISLAGNAWQAKTYLGVRDERTVAIGERDQARSAATACSDATEALRELVDRRQAENKVAIAQAAAAGERRGRKAAEILATPPSRPGDDCGSANDRFNRWLAEKGQAQ